MSIPGNLMYVSQSFLVTTVMTTLRSPRGDLAEAQFMARSGDWQHGEVGGQDAGMFSLGLPLHSTWRQVRGHSVTGAAVPRVVCRCRPRPPPASPSAQRAGYSLLCTAAPHLHTYCLHTVITD